MENDTNLIEALKKENRQLKLRTLSLESELTKYQGSDRTVSNEILSEVQDLVEKRDNLLRQARDTIKTFQTENQKLTDEYNAESEKNAKLVKDNELLAQKIESDTQQFLKDIKKTTKDLEEAKKQLEENAAIKDSVVKLESENEQLKEQVDLYMTKLSAAKNILFTIFLSTGIIKVGVITDIDKILASGNDINAKDDKAESTTLNLEQLSEKDSENSEFDVVEVIRKISSFSNAKLVMESKLKDMESENKSKDIEIITLRDQNELLQEKFSIMESQVLNLQNRNQELEEELNNKKIELEQKIEIVNKKITEAETLQKTVSEIKSQMNNKLAFFDDNVDTTTFSTHGLDTNTIGDHRTAISNEKSMKTINGALTPSLLLNEMKATGTDGLLDITSGALTAIEKAIKVSGNVITEAEILRREGLLKQSLEHRAVLKDYVKQYKEKVARLQEKIQTVSNELAESKKVIRSQEKQIFILTTKESQHSKSAAKESQNFETLSERTTVVKHSSDEIDFKKQVSSLLQLLQAKIKILIDFYEATRVNNGGNNSIIDVSVSQVQGLSSEIEKFMKTYYNLFYL